MDKHTKTDKSEFDGETGWFSIKMTIVPVVIDVNSDQYIEDIEIIEQSAGNELREAIWSLTEKQQEILELTLDGWSEKEIAKRLRISADSICENAEIIRKRLQPYFRCNCYRKISW